MKINFVITDINYGGGGERVLITLSNYFVDNYDWDVTIVSLLRTNNLNPYKINKKIKIIYIDEKISKKFSENRIKRGIEKILKIIKLIFKIKKINIEEKINLIIGIGFENSWYLPFLKINDKIKIIGTQHTNYLDFDKKQKIEKIIWKILLKKMNKFVVLSKDAEKYFEKINNLKNIVTIENPAPFALENKEYPKEKIAICVGRLGKEKQVDSLIKIWDKLPMNYKECWKLIIIGDGSEREKVESIVQQLKLQDKVFVLGKISDVEKYYKKASIILSVSSTEAFPMVLLEASSFKVVPISYDCPTGPRNIILDGETGYLVELNNEQKMLEKIILLIENEDLREKMSQSAFENMKKYDLKEISKKWERIIN